MGRPFFPRGKNGPAHSFPGEKTDWGEIPACYTGLLLKTNMTIRDRTTELESRSNMEPSDILG